MSGRKDPIDQAPLPWFVGDEIRDNAVCDSQNRVVARVASRFYSEKDWNERGKKAIELATFICNAVNAFGEVQALRKKAVEAITIANGLAFAVLNNPAAPPELKRAAKEAQEAVKNAAEQGPRMEIVLKAEGGE